jgi:transposase-like protein
MTEERLPLQELLAKAGDGDFLRSVAEAVLQLLMEADVEGLIGAGRYERTGIGKSTVSKLCKEIDERVGAFLDRPLSGEWPYLWLDATYLRQREGGRIVSVAAIVAVAANAEGRREVVGLHIGPSEAETFWSAFLKSLVRRGLRGVKLVISDAHEGLKAAIARVLRATCNGAGCTLPAMRWPTCPRASSRWPRPRSAKPSSSPTMRARGRPGGTSPTASAPAGPSSAR